MRVLQAFRFELDPNDKTRALLAGHAGAARFAFNWGLATVMERLEARRVLMALAVRQGASVAAAEAWATGVAGPVPWSLSALRREWNRAKAEVAPWWAEYSKEAYSSGLDNLARALRGFFDSRAGVRRGGRVGWPRFKKRGRARRSFRVTTGSFGVIDARHVRLPRIGQVRTKEATVTLLGRLRAGTARVLSVAVSEQAGRWWVSFTCEVDRCAVPAPAGPAVGVDVGVKYLAVLSGGEQIPNPKHQDRYRRRQARLQAELARRRGPANARVPSGRWEQSKARLARTHHKVACARADGLSLNLAAVVAATGTASGAGTSQAVGLANAQGETRYTATPGCVSVNCEDSAGQPGQTATAAEQSTAA